MSQIIVTRGLRSPSTLMPISLTYLAIVNEADLSKPQAGILFHESDLDDEVRHCIKLKSCSRSEQLTLPNVCANVSLRSKDGNMTTRSTNPMDSINGLKLLESR